MIKNKNSGKRLSIVNLRKKQSESDQEFINDKKNDINNQDRNDDSIIDDYLIDDSFSNDSVDNGLHKTGLNKEHKPEKAEKSTLAPPNADEYYNNMQEGNDEEINLSEYLEIIYHHKFLITAITIVAVVLAIAYSLSQTPIYKASTKVFIQEDLMELQIINNKPMFKQSFDINTWVQIIKSSDISDRVARKLKSIYRSSEIQSMISCDTERDEKHIITISVTHKDQNSVAKIANTIFLALQEYDAEQRSDGFYNSIEYLKTQIASKQHELDALDKAISAFYKANNIEAFSTDFEDNLSKVQKFHEMLQTAEVEYSAVRANINKIKSDLESEDNDIISQTSFSEPLKVRLMNLEVDLARALTKYTEQHPRVKAIQQNIDNVKQLIAEGAQEKIQLKNMTANPVKQKLINDLLTKEGEAVALQQKIIALKRIIEKSQIKPSYQMELSRLQRDRDGIKAILLNLQEQLNSINLSANIESSRIKQLQKAVRPNNPINNKLKMNILIALVLGMGAGFGLAFLLHFLDNRVKSVSEFVKRINLPLIGTIPKYSFSPFLPFQVVETEEELEQKEIQKETSEAVTQLLALNLKYMQVDDLSKTYAIVSPTKGDGKTSIALQLAAAFTKEDYRVLLIDSDFHLKKSSEILDAEKNLGLSEILTAQVRPEDCIVHLGDCEFDLLPSGKQPPDLKKILASNRFTELIDLLKEDYNLILIDTPALLYVTDSLKVLPHTDGVILIARILHTTYHDIKKVIKRILLFDTEIIGTILNYSKNSIFDKEYEDYSYDYYSYRYNKYKYSEYDNNKRKKKTKFKKSKFHYPSFLVDLVNSIKAFFVFDDDFEDDFEDDELKNDDFKDDDIENIFEDYDE